MKITDVARMTASEIAEIELSEIARYVNAVLRFVVAVASITYLINFCVDVLIAPIAEIADADALTVVSIAVTRFLAFDIVEMNLMIIKN